MPEFSAPRRALIHYPNHQAYVVESIQKAFELQATTSSPWEILTSPPSSIEEQDIDLQWSDYDLIDWDQLDRKGKGKKMVNSYVIRKGLIRKNHLSHTISLYTSKHPSSSLVKATPTTIYFNLSFADELDELLMDELYDVQASFDDEEECWWILKAALADKGNGIRLFSTREQLERIFEEFEPESSDEEEDGPDSGEELAERNDYNTRVDSSQLREWVIQKYISSPLLLSPTNGSHGKGHKFHLRVYVVASGGLAVYVHQPFLTLFAPTPYVVPSRPSSDDENVRIDLSAHLTNTCLQANQGEVPSWSVNTLSGMGTFTILSGPYEGEILEEGRIKKIEDDVADAVGELFKAAVGAGTSFQALPNAFEIFGIDFLVDDSFQISLLEVNACPDFAQTGASLQSIIDHLFSQTLEKIVLPFFDQEPRQLETGEDLVDGVENGMTLDDGRERKGLRKVLEMKISSAW